MPVQAAELRDRPLALIAMGLPDEAAHAAQTLARILSAAEQEATTAAELQLDTARHAAHAAQVGLQLSAAQRIALLLRRLHARTQEGSRAHATALSAQAASADAARETERAVLSGDRAEGQAGTHAACASAARERARVLEGQGQFEEAQEQLAVAAEHAHKGDVFKDACQKERDAASSRSRSVQV